MIQGRERYPINLRYPRDLRDNVDALRVLPVVTASGSGGAGELADIVVTEGPPMLKVKTRAFPAGSMLTCAGAI